MVHERTYEEAWREGLPMFTVYDHPHDYPSEFVIRATRLVRLAGQPRIVDEGIVARGATLAAVRAQLQQLPLGPSLYCLPRQEGDDPVIVEMWI